MSEGQRGFLEFERPLVELEQKIRELRDFEHGDRLEFSEDLARLEKKADRLRSEIFSKLTRWQRVQLARHPKRPYTLDYLRHLTDDFVELHGDRGFADDQAIVGGLALFRGRKVLMVGHQKGRDTREKIRHEMEVTGSDGMMRVPVEWDKIVVNGIDSSARHDLIGMNVSEISRHLDRQPFDCVAELLIEARLSVSCLIFCGYEDNLQTIMRRPECMMGSDGLMVGERPHPRAWGTFPRFLAR